MEWNEVEWADMDGLLQYRLPERGELLDDVVLEASDHHLVLEQQVELVRVLAAAEEWHAVHDPALGSLPPSAPSMKVDGVCRQT